MLAIENSCASVRNSASAFNGSHTSLPCGRPSEQICRYDPILSPLQCSPRSLLLRTIIEHASGSSRAYETLTPRAAGLCPTRRAGFVSGPLDPCVADETQPPCLNGESQLGQKPSAMSIDKRSVPAR